MKSAISTIIAGSIAWIVALVFLLVAGAPARQLWICIVGFALGMVGLRYTIRRGRREKL